MNTPLSTSALALLQAKQRTHRDTLIDTLNDLSAQHQKLMTEIAALQQQVARIQQQQQQCEQELAEQERVWQQQQYSVACAILAESWQSLTGESPEITARLALQQQIDALLAEQPDLPQMSEEYKHNEQTMAEQVRMMSTGYRQKWLAMHEETRQQIAPYLHLHAELAAVPMPERTLALLISTDGQELHLVTPAPAENQEAARQFTAVVHGCFDATASVPALYSTGMTGTRWGEHLAFHSLIEYSGAAPLLEYVQQVFTAQAAQSALATGCTLHIALHPIDQTLWQAHVREIAPPAPKPVSLEERSGGWYSDADLLGWQRSLKTGSNSKWSMQARRLRTILMRLIGHGAINQTVTIPLEMLWEPLPEPHQNQVQMGLQHLIREGILLTSGPATATGLTVSINPERLDDVQELINRSVNDLWARMTTA